MSAGSPGELLRNFRAYIAGIHARLELVHERRTSQTLKSLVDISSRLTAVDMVAFILLFDDLRRVLLHRHGQLQQKSGLEIWALERGTENVMHSLSSNSVSTLRWWCFFTVLAKAYLNRSDLKNLWVALLISKLGRSWPRFIGNAYHLLLGTPTFQDCQLQLPVDRSAGQKHVAPRCQCGSRAAKNEEPRMPISVKLFGRKRKLKVPLWVGRSQIPKETWKAEVVKAKSVAHQCPKDADLELNCRLRTWVRDTDSVCRGLQSVKGLFRSSGEAPRCYMQTHDAYVHGCVDDALRQMAYFQQSLDREYRAYWGDVGVSAHVRSLKQNMIKAWDWAFIIESGAGDAQRAAFAELATQLHFVLSKTTWPDSTSFPYVERTWPTTDVLVRQYDALTASVAFHARLSPYKDRWFPVRSYQAGSGFNSLFFVPQCLNSTNYDSKTLAQERFKTKIQKQPFRNYESQKPRLSNYDSKTTPRN